jgi:hypothetical protein
MKCLLERARQQLQELSEREAVVRRTRGSRARLEKLWDPDVMRRDELVGRMYKLELGKMRSAVMQAHRCEKEVVEMS